jgi:hypothetical protein
MLSVLRLYSASDRTINECGAIRMRNGGGGRLFSNTLSLCSSLNIRDQVSHPYRTTGKIIVLYIPIFMFFYSRREDKRFWTEWKQALPEFNLLLISST